MPILNVKLATLGLFGKGDRGEGILASELRLYTINRGRMDDFVKVWREGVVPLRRQAGFAIEGAWVIEATNQFAWVVSLPDSEDWQATLEAYSQSPPAGVSVPTRSAS